MYGTTHDNDPVEGALALVKETFPNAASVEISFSGGNDEGGPDEMCVKDGRGQDIGSVNDYDETPWIIYELDEDGQVVTERRASDLYPHEYDAPKIRREITGPAYAEAGRILASPIDDEHGSFAGDFYVTGTVTWNLSTGEYDLTEDYEDEEEEL